MKRLFYLLPLIAITASLLPLLSLSRAAAVSGTCFFQTTDGPVSGTQGCAVSGYGDYGNDDVLPGRTSASSPDTIPGWVNDKSSFIRFVEQEFNSSNTHARIGAAFIIQGMRGEHDWPTSSDVNNWEARMNQSGVTFAARRYISINRSSWFDPDKNNTFYDNYDAGARLAIQIKYNGNPITTIETACGNLSNGLIPLPDTWTLKGTSKVDKTQLGPGDTAHFDHKVTNLSSSGSRATYDWQVKGQLNGNGYTAGHTVGNSPDPLPSASTQSAPGISHPDYNGNARYSFTFPSNAQTGDKYCQRIDYTNANGPGSGSDNSAPVCVTFSKDWTLTAQSKVSVTQVQRGRSVTFDHRVKNNGPSTATYSWQIEGHASYGASGYATNHNGGGTSPSTLPSDQTTRNTASGSYRPAYSGSAMNTFTFPASAPIGATYCERISPTNGTGPSTSRIYSSPVCVQLVNTVATSQTVIIAPSVTGQSETEVNGTVTYSGSVTVSNFPQAAETSSVTGWGYNDIAVQGTPNPVPPTRSSYYATRTSSYTPSPTKGSCAQSPVPRRGCSSWYWTCPSPDSNPPAGSTARCGTIYTYKCQTGSSFQSTSTSATCYDKYTCPSPRAGTYYLSSPPSSTYCGVYQCPYAGAPYTTDSTKASCDYRCSNGTGIPAVLSYGVHYAQGDHKCYQQPTFSLTCNWDDGTTVTIPAITSNGTYSCGSVSHTGSAIGEYYCAVLTPSTPSRWSANVQPGYSYNHQATTWGWDVNPDTARACTSFVGLPYLKVYGGDVRVGGGVGAKTTYSGAQSCTSVSSAAIVTQARQSDYTGAGAQGAAFASGDISGFISGQYNPLMQPMRKALSFSNTQGTMGGYFNANGVAYPPCIGFVDQESNATDPGSTIGGQTVNGGDANKKIYHHIGNVYISGDVVYSGSTGARLWSLDGGNIPLFQLVVEGNIYIGANVHELDGLYSAVKSAAGTGGDIYTCATGLNAPASGQTFGPCKSQLVVNGALAANHIYWFRDCGSLAYGNPDDETVYKGGTDEQTCSDGNAAAEIVNYSPEQWIRSVRPNSDTNYDAISSLPPVL